jgi:hypothetical protein
MPVFTRSRSISRSNSAFCGAPQNAELGLELELSSWAPWRLLERGKGGRPHVVDGLECCLSDGRDPGVDELGNINRSA